MGILITKRKQMRKLFIRTLALALCLTGTAQALREMGLTDIRVMPNDLHDDRGEIDT